MNPDRTEAKKRSPRTASAPSQGGAPASAKKTTRKRSGRKPPARRKAYWGVFNDLMQQVAAFEYQDRAEAEKTARQWTEKKRGSYFVRVVKQPVE